jgi:hypothetical protein
VEVLDGARAGSIERHVDVVSSPVVAAAHRCAVSLVLRTKRGEAEGARHARGSAVSKMQRCQGCHERCRGEGYLLRAVVPAMIVEQSAPRSVARSVSPVFRVIESHLNLIFTGPHVHDDNSDPGILK